MFTADYKKGFKGYRHGFLFGGAIGIAICLFTGMGWIVPTLFALMGGAIGFQLKSKKNGEAK